MPPKERVVVVGLGALTLGVTAVSALAGSAEASLYACAALLLFLFVCGYVLIRSRHQEPPAVPVLEAEQDETVWPPAPKREEPGTGSAGLLLNKSVSDTEETRTEKV